MSLECDYYTIEEAETWWHEGVKYVRWQSCLCYPREFELLEDAVKFMRDLEKNPLYKRNSFRIMHYMKRVAVAGIVPVDREFD